MNINTIAILITALQKSTAIQPVLPSDTEVILDTEPETAGFVAVDGPCLDANNRIYDSVTYQHTLGTCMWQCGQYSNKGIVGIELDPTDNWAWADTCRCLFTDGFLENKYTTKPADASVAWSISNSGSGAVFGTSADTRTLNTECYRNEQFNIESSSANFVSVGGKCTDVFNQFYDWVRYSVEPTSTSAGCEAKCSEHPNEALVGFEYVEGATVCVCLFTNGYLQSTHGGTKPSGAAAWGKAMEGSGAVSGTFAPGDNTWLEIGGRWRTQTCKCKINLNYSGGSGQVAFKLLPENKELLGQVKGLLRTPVNTVGRDQGEGTEAAGPVPIVV